MSDNEFKLRREVQELKAEVRRLRRMIEGGFAVVVLAIIMVFPRHPDLLIFIGVLSIGYSILFYTRGGQKRYEPQQDDGPHSR
jgi:hypothetical protein